MDKAPPHQITEGQIASLDVSDLELANVPDPALDDVGDHSVATFSPSTFLELADALLNADLLVAGWDAETAELAIAHRRGGDSVVLEVFADDSRSSHGL